MPSMPARPCLTPGCSALVVPVRGRRTVDRGYCPACASKVRKTVEAQRANSYQRGYNRKWNEQTRLYLRQHPLCECPACQAGAAPGALPSTVVDHRKPHRGDKRLFWDTANWIAMAKPCHDRKTVLYDGGFGRAPVGAPAASPVHPWAKPRGSSSGGGE